MFENKIATEAVERLNEDRKRSAPWRRAITSAFQDDFWGGANKSTGSGESWSWDDYDVMYERNALRGWVQHYIAAVMYSRVTPSVQASALEPLPPEVEPLAVEATKILLDEWFNGQPGTTGGIASQMKLAVRWNLMYGHDAFKYTLDGPSTGDPRAMVRLTVVPRWEIDWDPRKTNPRDLTWFLHAYRMPKDAVKARWTDPGVKEAVDGLTGTIDSPLGKDNTAMKEALSSEVMIAEWIDLSETYEVDPDDERRDPDADPTTGLGPDAPAPAMRGVVRWLLLDGGKIVRELQRGPAPLQEADGRPLSGIIPCILSPSADEPCRGIPTAATPYNIERVVNALRTWQTNAARKDMARKYAIEADRFDEDNREKLLNGRDSEFVEYAKVMEGDPNRPVVQAFVPSAVPDTINQMNALVEGDRQLTASSLSDQVSNDKTKYFTATQATMVGSYAENEIGEMRQTMDMVVVDLMRCFLRALRQAMVATGVSQFPVKLLDGQTVMYDSAWLDHPWQLGVSDLANTPMVEGSKRQSFLEAIPTLTGAALAADYGLPGPISAALGVAIIDYAQQLYKLPDSFKFAALLQKAATLPPPPPPPMPEGAPVEEGEEEEDDGGEGELAIANMTGLVS